ncbi:Cysteine Protease [Melia azedarach]|nr:Cysteine Protease [Melia azedarach]
MAFTLEKYFAIAVLMILATWASQAMSRTLNEASIEEKFEQWIAQHGRTYEDGLEKDRRFNIFKDNLALVEQVNNAGNRFFKFAMNKFADLTPENSSLPILDSRCPATQRKSKRTHQLHQRIQKPHHLAGTGQKKELSLLLQWWIDGRCLQYIIENQGIASEKTYPYEGRDGTCDKEKAEERAAQITKYEDVASNDEGALLNAVANQPVSVAIDARNLKLYDGGIFDGECGTSLNHGVTVVGLQREGGAPEGQCGVAMSASYPVADE